MAIRVGGLSDLGVGKGELKDLLLVLRRFVLSVPFVFCAIGAFFAFGAGLAPASKAVPVKYARHAALLYDSDWHYLRLIRAEEKRDTDSYRNDSGTLQHSNKHVLALVFKPGGTTTIGGTATMPTTTGGTTSTTGESTTGTSTTGLSTTGGLSAGGTDAGPEMGYPIYSAEAEPMHTTSVPTTGGPTTTGVTTGATTGVSTGSTTSSTTGSTGSGTEYAYYIWVETPGEIAPINGRTPGLVDSGRISAGVPGGVGGQIYPGEEAYIHLAATGPLSSGSLTVTLETWVKVYVPDDPATTMVNEEHYEIDSYFKTIDYDITKYTCQDAAIDTRKAFGTANREGELLDDPNAGPAELNFGNWVWKGGLFVGNLPWQTRDQSGLARSQLYPQTSSRTTPCRLATLSMFYRGTAPDVTNAVTLGTYIPGSSDTNLSSSPSSVTWATRWDIQPRTTPGSPRDDSKDPVFRLSFPTNTLPQEYANWQLTEVGTTDSTTPIRAFQAIGVAIEDEDTFVTTPASCWRYFGSQEYQADFSTFPENDSGPRLWVVDYDADSVFNHHWSP